ncbi:MAG TPA: delta-60 repeat domain-containing protein, partial [Opitutus sp.]|nr:delta-60 repeat domain-containing protein [Opitutus sp.]
GINTIALQGDGKILLGGEFTQVAGHGANTSFNRLRLARLNANGTLDESFNVNVDQPVFTLFVQADNKIVVGGSFGLVAVNNAATATARNSLVRLNADGTIDEDFDPNPNGPVFSVAQVDSKLVIGGRFTTLQPDKKEDGLRTRNFVARLEANGDLDQGFNLDLDTLPGNQVVKVAAAGEGKLLVAGAFSTLNSSDAATFLRRERLARVNADGKVDTGFDAGLGSALGAPIESLTVQSDGRLIAAGDFTGFGGTAATNLARFNLDSSPDTSFTPAVNGPVYAVAQQLTKGEPVATPRAGFGVLENNGQLRTTFAIEANVTLPTIYTVVVQPDGKLLIGGTNFTSPITGTSVGSLLRLNTNGTLDAAFAPKTNGEIFAIAPLSDGDILVGGTFTKVGDVDRTNIARLNSDGSLDTAFTLNVNSTGPVYAIAVQSDGRIVLGGGFTSIQTSPTSTTFTRTYAARIANDGTVDGAFDPGFNSTVYSILIRPEGKILLSGAFTGLRPNGATTTTDRTYAAQFNADGTFDTAFDLKLNGSANELALDSNNEVLIGGYFTRILGQTRNQLARINADNTLDAFNPNPNNAVTSIAVQPDGKILVSGLFNALQPNSETYDPSLAVPRNRAVRLNADGTIDPTFNPNFNSTVAGLVPGSENTVVAFGSFNALQPTGGLVVGGEFSAVNGIPVSNLALFGRDGSVSATFAPNPNGAVRAILPMTNGQTVVAGSFTTISGATRNRVARFTAADELDAGFNPNVDGGDVLSIALQADGKLVIGGSFTSVGGAARANLARLNTDGSLDGSFAPTITGAVNNIVVQPDGRLLITQTTGADTNSLVRLNASGSPDASFNAANNGKVNGVALQVSGHIVVGGNFTSIGGGNRSNLARLNPNGTLDAAFTSTPQGAVTALSIQPDGKILIGGQFNSVDNIAR